MGRPPIETFASHFYIVPVNPLLDGNAVVVGLQWGDEGKGKIVDFLTGTAEVVVRYCGGANAGHTVRIGREKYATHLLPVGVFRPGGDQLHRQRRRARSRRCCFREIDEFVGRGIAISPANLKVSYKAHLVMPYHMPEDAAREIASGAGRSARPGAASGPRMPTRCSAPPPSAWPTSMHEEDSSAKLQHDRHRAEQGAQGSLRRSAAELGRDLRNSTAITAGGCSRSSMTLATLLLLAMRRRGKRIVFEGRTRRPARYRSRNVSVRHQQQLLGAGTVHRLGRPAADGEEFHRHHEGLQHRALAAGHSPASRTTTSATTSASAATNTAPPPADRAAADGSMRWPCDTRSICRGSPPSC